MHQQVQLIKIPEAARRMSLSRSKVYLMAATGELPAVRIGNSVRIEESVLAHFVQEHSSCS